jgi:hypothetical protein
MNESAQSIFINFRESDQPWAAALLDLELSARYGDDTVFLASRSIRPGIRFDRALIDAARSGGVLLAVMGRRWVSARDQHGRRLIDRPDDWIRREVFEARRFGALVIPVLVGDVDRLERAALPADIGWLADRQYVRLRHRHSRQDIEYLCAAIDDGRTSS